MSDAKIHRSAFTVHIVPGSKKNALAGKYGDAFKIKVQAPAVEGQANEALCEFLAEQLGVKTRHVQIVKGELNREKWIEVEGLSQEKAAKILSTASDR